jgi:hypothetical protein
VNDEDRTMRPAHGEPILESARARLVSHSGRCLFAQIDLAGKMHRRMKGTLGRPWEASTAELTATPGQCRQMSAAHNVRRSQFGLTFPSAQRTTTQVSMPWLMPNISCQPRGRSVSTVSTLLLI